MIRQTIHMNPQPILTQPVQTIRKNGQNWAFICQLRVGLGEGFGPEIAQTRPVVHS